MAKRKPKAPVGTAADGMVSFQLRLDAEVHEKLKSDARNAGLSLNQLMQGILRWASGRLNHGRAELIGKRISGVPSPECVWFGYPTKDVGMGEPGTPGTFFFQLDYSDRKALTVGLQEAEVIDGKRMIGDHYIYDGEPSWEREAFRERPAEEKPETKRVRKKATDAKR